MLIPHLIRARFLLILLFPILLNGCDTPPTGPSYEGLLAQGKQLLESGNRPEALRSLQQARILEETNEVRTLIGSLQKELFQSDELPVPETQRIKGGSFLMGSNEGDGDETPVHRVTVSDFEMGVYEVTNAQICVFLNTTGIQSEENVPWMNLESEYCQIEQTPGGFVPKADFEDHPVVEFSWFGAVAYCEWLSKLSGESWRLPTEAEWEYAAGGGSTNRTIWSGTNERAKVGTYGNYMRGDPYKESSPVGVFEPNALGLYDMSGNVREWCYDRYSNSYYASTPNATDPKGPASGNARVNRGGSWGSDVKALRVANRDSGTANIRKYYIGFRVAKDVAR